jgi:hypothetical protein
MGFNSAFEGLIMMCGMPLRFPIRMESYFALRLAFHRFCAAMFVVQSMTVYRNSDFATIICVSGARRLIVLLNVGRLIMMLCLIGMWEVTVLLCQCWRAN